MLTNRSGPQVTVTPVLLYPDVRAAVAWLEAVLGFEERVRIGESHRAQLRVGLDGAIVVAEASRDHVAPSGGGMPQLVKLRVADVDAAFARAREAGVIVLEELTTFEYGERSGVAEDLAGHRWEPTQALRDVAPEEWGGPMIAPLVTTDRIIATTDDADSMGSVGTRKSLFERECFRRWSVGCEEREMSESLIERREFPCQQPPQDNARPGRPFEPVEPSREDRLVIGLVGEREQIVDRFPHREVDDHERVIANSHIRRVSLLTLQSPDEARAPICQRVHLIEAGHEARQKRVVERRNGAGDVELRELKTRHRTPCIGNAAPVT